MLSIGLQDLINKYHYFLIDCDGVVWHDSSTPIGDAFKNIEYIESLGKKVFFVTNESSKSRQDLAQVMSSQPFGYQNVQPDNIYSAATIAALFLKKNMGTSKKIWV